MIINRKNFITFLKVHQVVDMIPAKWKIQKGKLLSAISTIDRTILGIASVELDDNTIEDGILCVLNTEDILKSLDIVNEDTIELIIDKTYLNIYGDGVKIKLMLALEDMIPKRSVLSKTLREGIEEGLDKSFIITDEILKKLKKVYSTMGKPEFITISEGKLTIIKDSNESHKVEIIDKEIPDIDITVDMTNFLNIIKITDIKNIKINTSQKICKIGDLYFKSL